MHVSSNWIIHLKKANVIELSEKKVQKLPLGLYLFKRYTFVPKGCILVLIGTY